MKVNKSLTTTSDNPQHSIGDDLPDDVVAINAVFELFRINFGNQYYAVYTNQELLHSAKRMWRDALAEYSSEQILLGAPAVIKECEYLPNLKKMIDCVNGSLESHGLPDVRAAYIEACRAPSPKAEYNWTHPAVYLAGKKTDWYFLLNSSENVSFPAFKANYEFLCREVLKGVEMNVPQLPKPEVEDKPKRDPELNRRRLDDLMKSL